MKILAIRGKNLASLSGDFALELEQEPLKSVGLIGITGPTGSGKTTMLDALCLALFDRIPRLDHAHHGSALADSDALKTSDPRSILSRGTAHGYAEVDFQGHDGHNYRARWELRRARGRVSGKLQTAQMTLRALPSGELRGRTKTEVLQEVEAVLGLSYSQFRRSVLLAQGDFASFLLAGENERAQLLERMTGTQIYAQVSRLAYQKAQESTRELQQLEQVINSWAPMPGPQRKELESELKKVLEQRKNLSSELKTIETGLHWHRHRQELEKAEREAKLKVEQAETQRTRRDQLREECGQVARARSYRKLHEEQEILEQRASQLHQLQSCCKDRNQAVPHELCRQLPIAQTWQNTLTRSQLKAEELQKLVKSSQILTAEISALKEELDDCQKQGKVWQENFIKQQGLLQALEKRWEAFPRDQLLKQAQLLSQDQQKHEHSQHLLAQHIKLAEEKSLLESSSKALEKELQELAIRQETDDKRAINLDASLKEAQATLERLKSQLSMSEWRSQLQDGEPCPLCGSCEHPLAHEDIRTELLNDQQQRCNDLQAELSKLHKERLKSSQSQAKLEAQHQALSLRQERLSEALAASDIKSLEEHSKQLKHSQEELLDRQKKINEQSRDLQEIERELLAQREHFHRSERERQAGHEQYQALRNQWEKELARENELRKESVELESARTELEKQLAANFEQVLEEVEKTQKAVEEGSLKLQKALHTLGWSTEQLKHYLSRDEKWLEATLAKLQEQEKQASLWQGRWDQAQQLLEEHLKEQPNAKELEELKNLSRDLTTRQQTTEQRCYEVQGILKADSEKREKTDTLQQELNAKRAGAAKWEILRELIGSSDGHKFRRYAQSLTLELLLAQANHQLHEIMPRYSLERVSGSDLDLQIVDHDMGDERRSAVSLSGGESFLVSLALALGLSSLAAERNRVLSLFIDEGFGALDPDSVDIAITALESLQASGRQVAVISHLPSLIERLGTTVQLTPRGGGKSQLTISTATGGAHAPADIDEKRLEIALHSGTN